MRLAAARRVRKASAAALLALAVFLVLRTVLPAPPGGEAAVATRDLPAGHVLTSTDLRTVRVPAHLVPAGALDPPSADGRRLALPLGDGEILTGTRLRPATAFGSLAPTERAVHVRVADPGALDLVHPGDRVDLLAAPDGRPVATDVRILGVDPAADALGPAAPGGGLVVAAPASTLASILSAPDGVHPAFRSTAN